MADNNKQLTTNCAIGFYNVHGHFNSHCMGTLVLYTCIFVEKWVQCFTVCQYQYWYWVLGSLLGIVVSLKSGYCSALIAAVSWCHCVSCTVSCRCYHH